VTLDELRTVVRDRIERGVLPREKCQVTWFGRGSGQRCAVCDLVIAPADIECECEHPRGEIIRFHQTCFAVWDELREQDELTNA
jgi:hypothetical protein